MTSSERREDSRLAGLVDAVFETHFTSRNLVERAVPCNDACQPSAVAFAQLMQDRIATGSTSDITHSSVAERARLLRTASATYMEDIEWGQQDRGRPQDTPPTGR